MPGVIGLVPTAQLFVENDPFADKYAFVNNYVKRVAEAGGTPIGMLGVDGHAAEGALALCDGFLLCGGNKLWPYHFAVLEHALAHGKPVLGICLGMQAICAYAAVRAGAGGAAGSAAERFEEMKARRYMFNLPVQGHWDVHITRDNTAEARHAVDIQPGTLLAALLGEGPAMGVTLHRYRVNAVHAPLRVNALARDGVVEGVELPGRRVLGVQFHPEVDDTHAALFAWLVREAGTRGEADGHTP